MSNFKHFFLNGKEYATNQELTLCEVINYFKYSNSLSVIEYNHKIYPTNHWQYLWIQPKDIIEIVTIVGGG